MTDGIGPSFAAGFQAVTKSGYPLLFLPDANNDALQREGKGPIYHWLPNSVRLAQKENGDYKFSFVHFVGVRNQDSNVGVQGTEEVSGALCGFSTTSSPPPAVLQEATDELINRFRGSDDYFWGWRSPATPQVRPAPIVSNTMSITSLSPQSDGSMPSVAAPAPGAPDRGLNRAPAIAAARVPAFRSPRTFAVERAMRASNLDPWYCNLDGEGPGSVTPFSENAFSGLVGSIPAAIIYQSFHGTQSPITVWQTLQLKVWSPIIEISIIGDWSRVQDHFSAAAHAGGLFWSADIKAEYNAMRQNGTIMTDIKVDETLPNAAKIQEEMEKRSDLVFQKFMDQAQKTIFEPAPYTEQAAQASGGFLGFGGGGAVKLRRDRVDLHLEYHEKRQMAYLQPAPISGQLEGLYDQIKADPAAEKKYFTLIDLGDWDRKVTRVFKPVVNWPDAEQKWVGQPVAFLSAQVGYPDVNGSLNWAGHIFQASDGPDAKWETGTAKKGAADVANPPAGWEPDKTFVKRQVHFGEPPNETENPFVRVSIEKNVVDLDPGDEGVPISDINLEIRVDNVGAINAGPMFLNVDLENDKQIVEVTFQAEGQTAEGNDRAPVKFSWMFGDQREPRYWMVYTGDPDYLPKYKYQVRVLVKGSIFTKGKEWVGPWQEASGNGPLMLSVPTPEDEGVQVRELHIPMLGAAAAPALPGKPPSASLPPAPTTTPPVATTPPAARPPVRATRDLAAPITTGGWSLEPPATGGTSGSPAAATAREKAPARREAPRAKAAEPDSGASIWEPLRPRIPVSADSDSSGGR